MRSNRHSEAEALIAEARQGMRESLGRLLQTYANYIKLVAAAQVGARLQVRVSPSDVVQETFLQAHRTFDQFRGRTEAEFLAWLQRILASQLTHLYEKHMLAEKRDVRRKIRESKVCESIKPCAYWQRSSWGTFPQRRQGAPDTPAICSATMLHPATG